MIYCHIIIIITILLIYYSYMYICIYYKWDVCPSSSTNVSFYKIVAPILSTIIPYLIISCPMCEDAFFDFALFDHLYLYLYLLSFIFYNMI